MSRSPSGEKQFIAFPPIPRDPDNPHHGHVSPLIHAVSLLKLSHGHGLKTICFTKTRQDCESTILFNPLFYLGILKQLYESGLGTYAAGYRGGYSIQDRKTIQTNLSTDKLSIVVCTNALELGVDIGSLDVVLHVGFPGVDSFKQQAGRVGRRMQQSVSIWVNFKKLMNLDCRWSVQDGALLCEAV